MVCDWTYVGQKPQDRSSVSRLQSRIRRLAVEPTFIFRWPQQTLGSLLPRGVPVLLTPLPLKLRCPCPWLVVSGQVDRRRLKSFPKRRKYSWRPPVLVGGSGQHPGRGTLVVIEDLLPFVRTLGVGGEGPEEGAVGWGLGRAPRRNTPESWRRSWRRTPTRTPERWSCCC